MLSNPCFCIYLRNAILVNNGFEKEILRPNTLLEDLYNRSVTKNYPCSCKIKKTFLEGILLEKKKFYRFSSLFFLIITIKHQKIFFFPNKYWRKCWFQGQMIFISIYFSDISPFVETEAALFWWELSLDSCDVFLLGEFIGTGSWLADAGLAAFGDFVEESDGPLWWLLSEPEVDECLFLPNSSLIGGCKLWKTTQ